MLDNMKMDHLSSIDLQRSSTNCISGNRRSVNSLGVGDFKSFVLGICLDVGGRGSHGLMIFGGDVVGLIGGQGSHVGDEAIRVGRSVVRHFVPESKDEDRC